MFACFECPERPFEMQSIWQWNVDAINLSVVEDVYRKISAMSRPPPPPPPQSNDTYLTAPPLSGIPSSSSPLYEK